MKALPRSACGVMLAAVLTVAACSGSPSDERHEPRNYTSPRALDVLGEDTYLGFTGGLYPGGANTMPAGHRQEALRRLRLILPRDTAGNVSAAGRIVLLSVGYSNVAQEFCSGGYVNCSGNSFMGQAAADPAVNHATLRIVNGAAGGQVASLWDDPADPNYERVRSEGLRPSGLAEAQVQVVWLKLANIGPRTSLPADGADAYQLLADAGEVLRALRQRYRNLQLVFASSRTYGGWATGTLNPEPYAFESGFVVQWAIEAQVEQSGGRPVAGFRTGDVRYDVAPWLGWGPYIWAGGAADPLAGWTRADFAADGVHPSASGVQKVGRMLLDFLKGSELAQCWFLAGPGCA